jgi:hypothetical protein
MNEQQFKDLNEVSKAKFIQTHSITDAMTELLDNSTNLNKKQRKLAENSYYALIRTLVAETFEQNGIDPYGKEAEDYKFQVKAVVLLTKEEV